MLLKTLSIFGTRPEAIKMAPLMHALKATHGVSAQICLTGQHRSMLDQVMDWFKLEADYNLDVMVENQTLNGLCGRLFSAVDDILEKSQPNRVLVHGDTSTAFVAAMAAFHRRIPVAHVEAGLRTGDIFQPWPEEMNRRAIDIVSDLLFAPTTSSRDHLKAENLQGKIFITGNTVIDALHYTVDQIKRDPALQAKLDAHFPFLSPQRKVLLVTGHRRENFGEGFNQICTALAQLSKRQDISIVYPVHLNPNVQSPVLSMLGNLPDIHLIPPLDYLHFVRLMQHAHVVLTDSGGVQEEAPALGKPVLVMRDVTERPEALKAGTVQLVGTDSTRITAAVNQFYDDDNAWLKATRTLNPYGDGLASQRIVAALTKQAFVEFNP